MNNVYAKNLKEILKETKENKTSATFFATGKVEQCYIVKEFSGIKLILVNASYEAVVLKENLEALGERTLIFPEVSRVFTQNYLVDDALVLKTLMEIEDARTTNKNLTIIFTPNTLCGVVPNAELIKRNFISLKVNDEVNINALTEHLINLGYIKVDAVNDANEFSVKGDSLTIYENSQSKLYRISFFGDEVEEIFLLDKSNFSKIETLDILKISGNKIKLTLTETEISELEKNYCSYVLKGEALENYRNLFAKLKETAISDSLPFFILPLLGDKGTKICNYFKNFNLMVFLVEPHRFSETLSEVLKANLNTYNSLYASGLITSAHKACFTADLFSFFKNTNFNFISFQNLLSSNNFFKTDNFLSLETSHQTLMAGLTPATKTEIQKCLSEKYEVNIVCQNEFTKNVVKNELAESCNLKNVNFYVGTISSTTILPIEKIAIFGIKSANALGSENKKKNIINVESFKEGDYVVHSFHGIGRFEGIVKRTIFGVDKDYIAICYQGGSKLFVPCENSNMLSKYSGSSPRLSVMGGKDFAREKNRVRASVKELAFNLAKLYAERRERKGFKFASDDELQAEFEQRFAYVETPGQQQAILDVKRDMQSTKIMDRLICGDVGFGKTEVAMRAAFKAVLSGKQVCVLAPTTVLALQHFKTFKARFDAYQINISLLCRFVTGKEEKEALNNIASGKSQIVIGTHRVLSDDVKFFDLGLFITDEEQRFGTGQKEKIKNIKKDIDSISLSATPIPRTLHLSLINVRDISVIDTPPKNRIPVQIYVCTYSLNLILTAIENEIARGGQVLIVYNNTEKVEQFALTLKNKLNGITVDFGHAKLTSRVLEEKILKVFNNETQVFVSTTIIENGVDLKNANTLIVIDSDRFGLSQLYQLKGRVGRGSTQAYAYFLTSENKTISEDADKRLNALMEFSSLGSGLEIAKKDLEIRGAGNIFGAEQSGHMNRIGYEEYVKILDEEVKKASGESVSEKVSTTVETDVNMFIDYTFAPSTEERTKIYKDLSSVTSEEELSEYLLVLKNKFGSVPESVKNIGEICLIKNLASEKLNAEKLIIKKEKCAIIIDKNKFSLSNDLYKKMADAGFVLNLPKKATLNLDKLSDYLCEKVQIELVGAKFINEKISKLKQIVC